MSMEEMTEEDVETALDVLENAQETLDEQDYWQDSATLDKAAAILSVGFTEQE